MIPPSFDYVAPKTLSEAIDALGEYEDAKILAGGQSLIPLMRFRFASPAVLVDLNRVEGLGSVERPRRDVGRINFYTVILPKGHCFGTV